MSFSLAGLFADYSQNTRLLRLHTPLGANILLAESVHGEEALSAGYTFTITALSLDAGMALRSLIGQPALLELLTLDTTCRPFHGHLTMVEQSGANGGLARYTLTLEPWTAFLTRNRDSRVFHHKTVPEILDAVLSPWRFQGTLAPAWRYQLAHADDYPKRSQTVQYQESDWAFASRLMTEAGLFYYFEHEADVRDPRLGSHRLVIADHNSAFKANRQDVVRFIRSGAVVREDSLDRWRCDARLLTNTVELVSWDYRANNTRRVSAGTWPAYPAMVSRDAPGQYAYPDLAQGQRMAQCQLDAITARRRTFAGAGNVRTFAPGTTFRLDGHPLIDRAANVDERRFLITRVRHTMRNNLHAELHAKVAAHLGPDPLPGGGDTIYRNRIDAMPAAVAYRTAGPVNPAPTVCGQQTAIVVGPKGANIHTDRDHRVKVQFHWQRATGGLTGHSRLQHPVTEGHTGAPADDSTGTWVRVASTLAPIAGANWGAVALPRPGQEVLLDFIEGNIDRPVIIGSVYNSAGNADAPHTKGHHGAGVSTANAPAWFPGARGPNAHAAVLSGLKSQALATSQWGTGAYSQLVFDDSAGQSRVSVQRHAVAHQGTDELNMGYLRHQVDNQRLQSVGRGAELKTTHSLAVRAGQGLLLSSDAQYKAAAQMNVDAARAQVEAASALQMALAETAQKHNAGIKNQDGSAQAPPADLAPIAQMRHSAEVLGGVDAGVPAWTEPMLQLSGAAGIVASTPGSVAVTAGATSSMTAGQAVNVVAQGRGVHVVKHGISLFTYGKGGDKNGIAMHAASGKVSAQSQSGAMRLTADKGLTVASINKSVTVAAKTHVLLTAQGASLKLEGGNISLHCPGQVDFKATAKELAGPVSVPSVDIAHQLGELNIKRDLEIEYVDADGNPPTGEPIDLIFGRDIKQKVTLDASGKATVKNVPLGQLTANQPKRK